MIKAVINRFPLRGFSAEEIAWLMLKKMGYKILEWHHQVKRNNRKIAEIDLIAEDTKGLRYGVEVKAGKIGVSDVRQTYGNAVIEGLKPLIVCQGFSEESARLAAEELGVKVITFGEYFLLLSIEDLYMVVSRAVKDVMASYGLTPPVLSEMVSDEDLKIISAISSSTSMNEAAEKANVNRETVEEVISRLKKNGVIPRDLRGYNQLRNACRNIVFQLRIQNKS